MPVKKRGGQPGNQNAVTHGRYSAPVRAARLAAFTEKQRLATDWAKSIPPTDYGAIIFTVRDG